MNQLLENSMNGCDVIDCRRQFCDVIDGTSDDDDFHAQSKNVCKSSWKPIHKSRRNDDLS